MIVTCMVQQHLEIFCGLKSGKINVYDHNLRLVSVLDLHRKEIAGMCVSNEILVSISKDSELITWSLKTKQHCSQLKIPGGVTCVSMVNDKIYLGTESGDVVTYLHMGRGDIVHEQSIAMHTGTVTAIDTDETLMITGGKDTRVRVWSSQDYQHVKDLDGHKSPITCIKLKAPLVVSGSRGSERSVRIWNIESGETLRYLRIENNVRSIDFNAERLVTGDDDGYVVFWDMKKCFDPDSGTDELSYRSHNTYVEGSTSAVILVGRCLLMTSSGKMGQVTVHDYWKAAAEDKDHTDSW